MNIATLGKYLVGNKQAILQITETRGVLWLGLLFVVAAGFAREYDGEDLMHEPWHLAIPLAASIVSSFILYVVVWCVAAFRTAKNPFLSGYARFLALYWMTAPLALVYAIPVERFMTAADSVRANLWMLAIVAAWRVALITRAISVVYRCRHVAAFFVVMLFSDKLAQAAISFVPMPIVSVMGGIRLTEAESVILGTTFMIRFFGILSLPVWLIGVWVIASCTSQPNDWQTRPFTTSSPSVGPSLWLFAFLTLAIWPFVLPQTQPEQVNRRVVESRLNSGDVSSALAYMSERDINDFPPHWDPPPRIGYGESKPDIFDVLNAINQNRSASWVRTIFVDKILLQSSAGHFGHGRVIDLAEMSEDDLAAYIALLQEVGNGSEIAASHESEIEDVLWYADEGEEEWVRPITESRRQLLLQLRDLIPIEEADADTEPK